MSWMLDGRHRIVRKFAKEAAEVIHRPPRKPYLNIFKEPRIVVAGFDVKINFRHGGKSIEETNHLWDFKGFGNSIFECVKDAERMCMNHTITPKSSLVCVVTVKLSQTVVHKNPRTTSHPSYLSDEKHNVNICGSWRVWDSKNGWKIDRKALVDYCNRYRTDGCPID